MGSKRRIAKYILPIILRYREHNQYYVEPFVGGGNTIDKVRGRRIGNDINYFLIEMFKKIQEGWIPPSYISEDEYLDIKKHKEKYPPHLVGFVGFGCSYGGTWFTGYAHSFKRNGKELRNHCKESRRNILKQSINLKGVLFTNLNYWKMNIPNNSIIYCDPPYINTGKYENTFNHKYFWEWCRKLNFLGHKVFISEYTAPNDFISIWSRESLNGFNNGIIIEKLFVHRNQRKIIKDSKIQTKYKHNLRYLKNIPNPQLPSLF